MTNYPAKFLPAILSTLLLAATLQADQPGTWATPNDPVANSLIEMERKWAESACTNHKIEQTILADDYQGTAPEDGKMYSKQDALHDAEKASPVPLQDCQLHGAKVRFFGSTLAIVYGSESLMYKDKSGKDTRRSLIWTDTWLKRNGKWQIIAAQDMNAQGMKMERK